MCVCVCVLVAQLCPTLCDPMDCSPPGFSVRGILQARILEWVAIPFSYSSFYSELGALLLFSHKPFNFPFLWLCFIVLLLCLSLSPGRFHFVKVDIITIKAQYLPDAQQRGHQHLLTEHRNEGWCSSTLQTLAVSWHKEERNSYWARCFLLV